MRISPPLKHFLFEIPVSKNKGENGMSFAVPSVKGFYSEPGEIF